MNTNTDDAADRIREDRRAGIPCTIEQPDLSRLAAKWRAEALAIVSARLAKARAIVELVPVAVFPHERLALAACLEGWDQAQRDRFAHAAGQNSPSVTTWAWVVDAVKNGRAL